MRAYLKAAIAASLIPVAMPAAAATQIVDGNGKLTGATGVTVNGKTYNVQFADGTCASVYGACEAANFDFQDDNEALIAAYELMSQVFLNTSLGSFDTQPGKTLGCSSSPCYTFIVSSVDGDTMRSGFAINNVAEVNDGFALNQANKNVDYGEQGNLNFARFTLATANTSAVPEPATWAMMLSGFGAIGAAMRRRQRVSVRFA